MIVNCTYCGCSIRAINTTPDGITIVKRLTEIRFINEREIVCHCGSKHDIRYVTQEYKEEDSWVFAL